MWSLGRFGFWSQRSKEGRVVAARRAVIFIEGSFVYSAGLKAFPRQRSKAFKVGSWRPAPTFFLTP